MQASLAALVSEMQASLAALAFVVDCLLFETLSINFVAERWEISSYDTGFLLEWKSKLCLSKKEHKLGLMAHASHPGT